MSHLSLVATAVAAFRALIDLAPLIEDIHDVAGLFAGSGPADPTASSNCTAVVHHPQSGLMAIVPCFFTEIMQTQDIVKDLVVIGSYIRAEAVIAYNSTVEAAHAVDDVLASWAPKDPYLKNATTGSVSSAVAAITAPPVANVTDHKEL
ncbi:hypothetical protein HDU98_007494 [Podochytrium sp. JEL0797]|nr:hypothetical protein HDU98_007494 [Podochytrium sp. JEL0797]